MGEPDTPLSPEEPTTPSGPNASPTPSAVPRLKKPDFGLFTGIVGVLLAILIPILQWNGIQINWEFSAIAYAAVLVGAVWTYLTHAVPHCGKIVRGAGALAIGAVLALLGTFATCRQYRTQYAPPPVPLVDTNAVKAIETFRSLADSLSNNPSDARVAILTAQQKTNGDEMKQLALAHQLIVSEPMSLETIREERAVSLKQLENEKQRQDIQAKIDAIKSQKQREKDEATALQNQRISEQNTLQQKRELSIPPSRLFDYVIQTLIRSLIKVSHGSGWIISSDFGGESPSIYVSRMEKDGVIVNGTNIICLGTNAAWRFECATSDVQIPQELSYYFPRTMAFTNAELRIASRTTNGVSTLVVSSLLKWQWGPRGRMTNDIHDEIAIVLSVPNGLNMNTAVRGTNYMNDVDEAVRRFVAAQDQQFPIPGK